MDTLEMFARSLVPLIQKFYEDPKNQAAFEAWKADEDAKKGEDK